MTTQHILPSWLGGHLPRVAAGSRVLTLVRHGLMLNSKGGLSNSVACEQPGE